MVSRLFKIIKGFVQNNRKALIFWILPLLLALAFQSYGFGINRVLPRNFAENTATLIIIISFSLLFNYKWRKFFQMLGYVIFLFNNLFESIYFYIFKANISASSFYILLETNLAEAGEFVEFYLNPFILLMIISFIFLLSIYLIKRPILTVPKIFRFQKSFYVFGVFIPLFLMIYKGYQQYNFLYLCVNSVFEYIDEQQKMQAYDIDKPMADIKEFKVTQQVDTATYVLVIGESATRYRMSLYGYDRKTTPFLDSIKQDLWVYDDVISSHVTTIGSLRNALTLNALKTKKDFSIIQLMNQADFKTYWISNQRPIGQFESLVTNIAMSSNAYIPENTADYGTVTPYDEVLIPEFKKAIKDAAPKKFIVLHLLGNHSAYSYRYPEEFEKFKGKSPSKFDHERAHKRFNTYDNAILYNDYFLKKIYQNLQDLNQPSYLIYFSDHGDEVYESIDFSGHSQENPTKTMYDIPFFIWMNDSFKSRFNAEYLPHNPYKLNEFFHTFSDLNGIRFKDYDSTRSIFYQQDTSKLRKFDNGEYYKDLP